MVSGRQRRIAIATMVAWGAVLVCWGAVTTASAASPPCPNASLRTGLSESLPDCRAYEQVSPTDKGGIAAYETLGQQNPSQTAPSGEKLAYLTFGAFPGSVGNSATYAGHVSTRSASGWRTAEWTPAIPRAGQLNVYEVDYAFSEDLTQAVIQVPTNKLLPEATPNVFNLYLRHPEAAYTLVNAGQPTVSAESFCEAEFVDMPNCFEVVDLSAYAGASGDMRHVLFESTAQWLPGAPATGTETLYENAAGHVRLVGVLPDGTPANGSNAGSASRVGYRDSSLEAHQDGRVEHAVSLDGSDVVFQAPADEGGPSPAQNGLIEVYDRLGGVETVELSAPAPGATPKVATPEPATFWTASDDGSHVFFTSAAELTTESNTGSANNGEDLYEYNLPSKELRDLTIDTNAADESTGAMVQGVVGASSDGAYVYFVAEGQLVAGKGVDGQPNLYVVHNGGAPMFIATLNPSTDASDWTHDGAGLRAQVTRDGLHVAFMSRMSLPTANFPGGYNNLDQESGQPDSEAYVYSVGPTEAESRLVCASCDLSGNRPVGDAAIGGDAGSTAFSKARAISENGSRVFYTARQSLEAPGGTKSIFEYEAAGEGECLAPRGCQYLLSAKSSTADEAFLGAGANGDDVFIATTNRLAPGDADHLADIYDVRVDGGFPTAVEPSCEEGCHTPTAPAGGPQTPSTAVVGPSGNLAPLPPPPPPTTPATKCKKGLALSHGKCIRKCAPKHKRAHGKCVRIKQQSRTKARGTIAQAHNTGGTR